MSYYADPYDPRMRRPPPPYLASHPGIRPPSSYPYHQPSFLNGRFGLPPSIRPPPLSHHPSSYERQSVRFADQRDRQYRQDRHEAVNRSRGKPERETTNRRQQTLKHRSRSPPPTSTPTRRSKARRTYDSDSDSEQSDTGSDSESDDGSDGNNAAPEYLSKRKEAAPRSSSRLPRLHVRSKQVKDSTSSTRRSDRTDRTDRTDQSNPTKMVAEPPKPRKSKPPLYKSISKTADGQISNDAQNDGVTTAVYKDGRIWECR